MLIRYKNILYLKLYESATKQTLQYRLQIYSSLTLIYFSNKTIQYRPRKTKGELPSA